MQVQAAMQGPPPCMNGHHSLCPAFMARAPEACRQTEHLRPQCRQGDMSVQWYVSL